MTTNDAVDALDALVVRTIASILDQLIPLPPCVETNKSTSQPIVVAPACDSSVALELVCHYLRVTGFPLAKNACFVLPGKKDLYIATYGILLFSHDVLDLDQSFLDAATQQFNAFRLPSLSKRTRIKEMFPMAPKIQFKCPPIVSLDYELAKAALASQSVETRNFRHVRLKKFDWYDSTKTYRKSLASSPLLQWSHVRLVAQWIGQKKRDVPPIKRGFGWKVKSCKRKAPEKALVQTSGKVPRNCLE